MTDVPFERFNYHGAVRQFTQREMSAGKAIRVVGCKRDCCGNGAAWIVLCFSRDNLSLSDPFLSGLYSLVRRETRLFGPVVHQMFSDDDEEWFVSEYELVVPLALRSFTVSWMKASFHVSWAMRNRMLDEHDALIRHAAADSGYQDWFLEHKKSERREIAFANGPLMSIVSPVFHTPPHFLKEMIDSVRMQTYDRWELIIVNASPDDIAVSNVLSQYDDPRIRVLDHPENDGISGNTNFGIAAANGDYLSFLDHDDIIEPFALERYADEIMEKNGKVDLLYCDEDSIDEKGNLVCPLFKPPLNRDLLYSNDYIIHWLAVSREVIERTARSSGDVAGAQDYDLTLKALEVSQQIVRVPLVLYHWRRHSGSTNVNPESKPYAQRAGQLALEGHFFRRGLCAEVFQEETPSTYKADFEWCDPKPAVTCLIEEEPSDGFLDMLEEYGHQGGEHEILHFQEGTPAEFNMLLGKISSDFVLVVRPGMTYFSENFMSRLVGYFTRSEVAFVSPRVNRDDGLIDFAGMSIMPDGRLMRLSRYLPDNDDGYIGRIQRPWNASVTNSEFFMFRKREMIEIGYLDEGYVSLPYALADVCLRWKAYGKVVVYTPFCKGVLKDYRSLFGFCDALDFEEDRTTFQVRYGRTFEICDPDQNPNFNPYSAYYTLRK